MAVLEFLKDQQLVMKALIPVFKAIKESLWMSLPELTNKNGEVCVFSCTAQAWSIGPIIELVQKLRKVGLENN